MVERGYRRLWLQCQRKIKNLRAKYKEAKDSNNRSGRGRVTCPFYDELDRILGDKPSVTPIELLDSCSAEEEPARRAQVPQLALFAQQVAQMTIQVGDGSLVTLSFASASEGNSAPSEDTTFNSSSNASSSTTGSTSTKSRKRKSKMEASLEVFAEKISSVLKMKILTFC
ncbi:hypothetical protein WMY93_012702 [Mugilogobius chulae]|uniref:Myb/SANT-like DNA-binding domain-containing protein n=1 Tax=Mugilogobius chulae TaxID=88201 RepID=A0AAW0P4D0_9GOBI